LRAVPVILSSKILAQPAAFSAAWQPNLDIDGRRREMVAPGATSEAPEPLTPEVLNTALSGSVAFVNCSQGLGLDCAFACVVA
jgi:hypothetical protein